VFSSTISCLKSKLQEQHPFSQNIVSLMIQSLFVYGIMMNAQCLNEMFNVSSVFYPFSLTLTFTLNFLLQTGKEGFDLCRSIKQFKTKQNKYFGCLTSVFLWEWTMGLSLSALGVTKVKSSSRLPRQIRQLPLWGQNVTLWLVKWEYG